VTDDQNQWYSDPNSGPKPPTVPDGHAAPADAPTTPPPGSAPQQYPHPYPQQPYPQPQYPQQPPAGYQTFGQPGYGPVAQSHGKATTSMVLGIVGLVSVFVCYGILGVILGPLAFFMGRSAEKEIDLAPNAWSNRGMARAGWIMGLIQIIIAVIAVIGLVAVIIWVASSDGSEF